MNAIRTKLTVTAGVVIIVLTGAAFWLSYAHLQEVADAHGLDGARSWAWPATLDLFIVAGEIMMLVAALAKRRDPWAIGLTVAGSVGSIGLNVYGVGPGAPVIEYIVAAVPPAAALLAFGALMRQVHAAIAEAQEAVSAPVVEVVEELEALEDDTEEEEEELAPVVETVSVHTASAKPTVRDIAAAVEDMRNDGKEPSGADLAAYFGVSDRTGRRYLNDWKADLQAAA